VAGRGFVGPQNKKTKSENKMKNTFVKSIGATALTLLVVGGTQMFVSGQDDAAHQRSIEGAWRTTITTLNCQTGEPIRTFPGLQTFNKGGTLAEAATGVAPSLRTPSHGVWSRVDGAQNYSFVFMHDRFNADGTYAGVQKVRGTAVLEASGGEFLAVATTEILNASGQVIATGCATWTATRIE